MMPELMHSCLVAQRSLRDTFKAWKYGYFIHPVLELVSHYHSDVLVLPVCSPAADRSNVLERWPGRMTAVSSLGWT